MNDIIKGYLELNKDQWVPLNTFILSKYIADLFKNKEDCSKLRNYLKQINVNLN